jgi:hypothetical protein
MNLLEDLDSRIQQFANRLDTTWLKLAVILVPILIAFLLPILFWGKTVFAFVPNSSDEVTYWREIHSFVDHSFNSGQYSNDELIARFTASPFGVHGPAFAVTYGAIGKLIGWEKSTPVLINFALLALTTYAAIRIVRPNNTQLVMMLMLLATWWPLQLYLTSNMQEVLHSSAAILLAALCYRLMVDEKSRRTDLLYISLILIFLVPFRYIWAFLFFPAIMLLPAKPGLRSWIIAAVGTGLLLAAGAWFVFTFYSPSPWFWSGLLDTLSASKSAALSEFVDHFLESAGNFVSFSGLPLVIVLRYQVLGILIASAIWLYRNRRAQLTTLWFTLFNLGSVLAFVLFFYDVLDTRDYRMLIGPLLLSVLLLLFTQKMNFVYPIIAANIIASIFFFTYYPTYRNENFNYDPSFLQEVESSINANLDFVPRANRWCNTISIGKYGHFNAFSYPLAVVDSGFGTTTILEWKQFEERPLQARYVIVDPEYSEPGFGSPVNHFDLVEISQTPIGTLYLNPRSGCQ